MVSPETALRDQCSRITRNARTLIQALAELENNPDDEAAYTVMYAVSSMAEAMSKARAAGQDRWGNDVLDAHEAVANAVRAAKEA